MLITALPNFLTHSFNIRSKTNAGTLTTKYPNIWRSKKITPTHTGQISK
jgi:hypothetical protein